MPFRTKTARRQSFPDEIRGFALMGIMLVNVPYLAISSIGFDRDLNSTLLDQITEFLVVAFFQTKFYLLFSFLFGYSAHLILSRAHGRSAFAMRLVGLAVLGVAHAALFFQGDILLSYALLGTVLLWAQSQNNTLLTRVTQGLGLASVAWLGLMALAVVYLPSEFYADQAPYDAFNAAAVGPSFLELVQARVALTPSYLLVIGSLQWGYALTCFFVGFLAGRLALLSNPERHAGLWRFCRRLGWLGFPLSLVGAWLISGPGSGGISSLQPREVLGTLLLTAVAPMLTAAYVGLLVRYREARPNGLAVFRSLGRMSLTSYLAQSVVLGVIFCGWGFGLYGALSNLSAMAVAVGVYLGLAVFAEVWFMRADQGPMEALMKRWSQLPSA